jgi:hypothetical protein
MSMAVPVVVVVAIVVAVAGLAGYLIDRSVGS